MSNKLKGEGGGAGGCKVRKIVRTPKDFLTTNQVSPLKDFGQTSQEPPSLDFQLLCIYEVKL
jgi:hypothetical protein